jgi:hypothetical protein
MHSASCWQQDYERLEQELEKGEYPRLLWRLRKVSPFLCRFDTWADVLAFMRAGTSEDPRKDKILQPIFRAHAQNGDHRWRTVLLVIFWPGLQSIFWQKSGWDPDPHERWQRVVWAFFHVICRIDLKQRPQRLVQKVINDTVHHLYRDYERDWNEAALAPSMAPELLEALAVGVEHIDFAVFEARDAQETEIVRLRGHMEAGRISEADFLLLVGTRVYGRPLADYAREHGLNYEAARKRRQRAEASLQRCEKKPPERTDFLSR